MDNKVYAPLTALDNQQKNYWSVLGQMFSLVHYKFWFQLNNLMNAYILN